VWPPLIAGSALHPDYIPRYIFLLKTPNAAPNDCFLIMIREGSGGPSTAAAWLPETRIQR
jgi:hypothetical protein